MLTESDVDDAWVKFAFVAAKFVLDETEEKRVVVVAATPRSRVKRP